MSIWPELRFLTSVAKPAGLPPDVGREIAVAGRSNAGKSSAINVLLARHGLARTSRTPGRTQLFNYFELAPGRRIVDLPGYGHASVAAGARENWGPLGEALRVRESLAGLLLIVDCRRGVGLMDLHFLDWAGRPAEQTHVLLSKADKLGRGAGLTALRAAQAGLAGKASCQLFSALKGVGVDEARAVIRRWLG
ncbi:MAG: ribosome biogenesis GTP-binding protein YihA/YsxC [Nevskiaceae bacterium]|nr:ribosome biogenesis GTP-binding protein YihA/YsxC [Nevskiaceae bacterium]